MNIPQRVVILFAGLAIAGCLVVVPWHFPEEHKTVTLSNGVSYADGHWAFTEYAPFFEGSPYPLQNGHLYWEAIGFQIVIIAIIAGSMYWAFSPNAPEQPSH